METFPVKVQVARLLTTIASQAIFHGAMVVECTGEGKRVHVTLCCVGHADYMVKGFRKAGMLVKQDGCQFTVRYPSIDDMRRMQ